MILILGAGLAGLSCSYHLGHEKCLLLEKNLHPFGHIKSEQRDAFTWDQGPHVSFTKYDYVRELFAASVQGEFEEYEISAANYFKGHWIDHPAQSSLYQVPEPLRSECLDSFLKTRNCVDPHIGTKPTNYQEWLEQAFGSVFASTFPARYTEKYWTRKPVDMSTDWIGERVFYPKVEDVLKGCEGPLDRKTHYITKVRYPTYGGYQTFARKMAEGARIQYGSEVIKVDLKNQVVVLANGKRHTYEFLINTLPLPVFLATCEDVPSDVAEAGQQLSCSQLLLVNVAAQQATARHENWMYVYDEDKFSTRINCTEKLSANNAPEGWTGVQVEVYFSRHRPLSATPSSVGNSVVHELVEMGLIDARAVEEKRFSMHQRYSPWANVIFDHDTKPALGRILDWLETQGLAREEDDLSPLTDWTKYRVSDAGKVFLAGRFGQWKYFWTDDCVMRGERLKNLVRD